MEIHPLVKAVIETDAGLGEFDGEGVRVGQQDGCVAIVLGRSAATAFYNVLDYVGTQIDNASMLGDQSDMDWLLERGIGPDEIDTFAAVFAAIAPPTK